MCLPFLLPLVPPASACYAPLICYPLARLRPDLGLPPARSNFGAFFSALFLPPFIPEREEDDTYNEESALLLPYFSPPFLLPTIKIKKRSFSLNLCSIQYMPLEITLNCKMAEIVSCD
jgi:hypothetical protein